MRQANKQEIEALPHYDARLSFFYVPEGDEFMEFATMACVESTDKKHSTGAVVVKDEKVLAMDSNQSGFKLPFLIRLHEKGLCVRRWLKIPSGERYDLCRGCAKPQDHAENRVVRLAVKKHGLDKVKGAAVYLSGHWWCCKDCSDAMINVGISTVVLVEGAKAKFGR